MKDIAVYTAIFDEHNYPSDNLKDFDSKYLEEADFYCFTNLNLKSDKWQIVKVDIDENDGRRMARKYKILPHLSMPEYKYFFWMDTSFKLLESPIYIVKNYLKDHDIVTFLHPDRECIYDEAKKCISWKLDNSHIIEKQMNFIRNEKYPKKNGLCETGVIIKRNNKEIQKFSEYWWFMVNNFSLRDQLSFNFSLWKYNIKYNVFDGLTNVQPNSPPGSYQTKHFKLYSHKK